MKVANRRRKQNAQSQTFTLRDAKLQLEQLIRQASKGEAVYIVRGQRRFVLQDVSKVRLVPLRPPGYFADCYTAAEIQEDNRLAKASVIRPPKDLE